MHPVALSLLASFYLVVSSPAPLSELSAAELTPTFVEVGKTTYAKIFIDASTPIFEKDPNGDPFVGVAVKIVLNTPVVRGSESPVASVVNIVMFSCTSETATVMASEAFDAKGKSIATSDKVLVLPWIKASDTATDVIMSKLCKGVVRKRKPGDPLDV